MIFHESNSAWYFFYTPGYFLSTHWGRVTHLCVSKLTSIASDNGLSPGRRQTIISNNAGILLIGPLGTNFSEILIAIQTLSLKKIRLKMLSAKCRTFCLGLNVLTKFGPHYVGDLEGVSLRLASSSNEFLWGCKFVDCVSIVADL